jgi:hypothetical protein
MAWAPGLSGATKTTPVISRYVLGNTVRARWPWVPLPQLDRIDMTLLLISFSRIVIVLWLGMVPILDRISF